MKKKINDNFEQVVCSLCLASVWATILWLVNVFSHNRLKKLKIERKIVFYMK